MPKKDNAEHLRVKKGSNMISTNATEELNLRMKEKTGTRLPKEAVPTLQKGGQSPMAIICIRVNY